MGDSGRRGKRISIRPGGNSLRLILESAHMAFSEEPSHRQKLTQTFNALNTLGADAWTEYGPQNDRGGLTGPGNGFAFFSNPS